MSCLSACKDTENCQDSNLVRLKKMPHVSVCLAKSRLMPFRRVPIANRQAIMPPACNTTHALVSSLSLGRELLSEAIGEHHLHLA